MAPRNDIGKFTVPLAITAILLLASLLLLSGTPADASRYSLVGQYLGTGWLSGIPALSKLVSLLLLAAGPFMYYTLDKNHPLGLGLSFTLIYSLLVFSCIDALNLSPVHIAAFFLTWSLFFSFKASLETYDTDNPFSSMLLLSVASLFFAPLIWTAPVMAVLDNNNSAKKWKTAVGSLCGLLLPMITVTGIHAIRTGYKDIQEPLMKYLSMVVDIDAGLPQIQVATAMKVLVLLVAAAWAAIVFFKTFNTLDIAAERCHIRCMVYALWFALTAVMFGNSLGSLPWMLSLIPLSFFLNAFFTKTARQRSGAFLLAIFLLLTLAERIVVAL